MSKLRLPHTFVALHVPLRTIFTNRLEKTRLARWPVAHLASWQGDHGDNKLEARNGGIVICVAASRRRLHVPANAAALQIGPNVEFRLVGVRCVARWIFEIGCYSVEVDDSV